MSAVCVPISSGGRTVTNMVVTAARMMLLIVAGILTKT
jgi:hypothetical protein